MFPSIVKPNIIRKEVKKQTISHLIVTGDNVQSARKRRRRKVVPIHPYVESIKCDCNSLHLTQLRVTFAPKSRKRGASTIVLSMTTLGSTCQTKRIKLRSKKPLQKVTYKKKLIEPNYEDDELFIRLESQLKALNLNKPTQKKTKAAAAAEAAQAQLTRVEEEVVVGAEEAGEVRRRGRRRRKGRQSTDRLTSAGLVATAAQDPETQIAGIGSDSHNASSRGSIAPTGDDSVLVLPALKVPNVKKIDSFLDEDILKYLHREVDEKSIETEFDTKRRYVLEEALRTRPSRTYGQEMMRLLREMKDNSVSLGDWLHVPGVFSRRNAQFSLPLDSAVLQTLNPMKYVARYVMPKKSKQLLYLTVLQRFRPDSYKMPVQLIAEGVKLMMGGSLSDEQVTYFQSLMDWDNYEEQENFTDDIKLTLARRDSENNLPESGDAPTEKTIKYRTWCGICAVCERMYGRFNSREQDPPDGMELSDFAMLETKLAIMKVDSGLVEILNVIRTR